MARAALNLCRMIVVTFCVIHAQGAWAQRQPLPSEGEPEAGVSDGIKRSYLQASFKQIRPGSYLRNSGKQDEAPPDRRSLFEQRRDTQLQAHYGRMAELDVMLEMATKGRNLSVSERIELIRRREIRRFFLAMQTLQVDILAQNQDFGP